MSVVDVEKLLEPLSGDSPCGPDLEYDPAFLELGRLAQGKPERAIGDKVEPAEEPDWREIKRRAIEFCGRSKDLRVSVLLARALLRTDGWDGFRDGLEFVYGLIARHWESVHPLLDPEEKNDPTMRVNTLVSLCSNDTVVKTIRETPLVVSRQLGRFSLRDIMIATGKLAVPAAGDEKHASTPEIDAAFASVELDDLRACGQAIEACIGHARAIESALTEKVGSTQAASFSDLTSVLNAARQPVTDVLMRRGAVAEEAGGFVEGIGLDAGPAGGTITGDVRSREDAIRMLEKVADYFNRHEPSSPVPILLERAKRLVSKSFVEIVRDLAPEGLAQVESIRGASNTKE